MKHINLNLRLLMTVMAMALFITGCSDNESIDNPEEQQQDYSEVSRSAEIDRASDSMDDIAIDVYEIQEESENNRTAANFQLPDCVTITVVMEQNYREITIDFGTEGCLVHGNLLKGKITFFFYKLSRKRSIIYTVVKIVFKLQSFLQL